MSLHKFNLNKYLPDILIVDALQEKANLIWVMRNEEAEVISILYNERSNKKKLKIVKPIRSIYKGKNRNIHDLELDHFILKAKLLNESKRFARF